MTSRLDRGRVRELLIQTDVWIGDQGQERFNELILDALDACVVPDRRIAALSALCNTEAGLYGYLRTEDIRNILRGGS
jgi:hypothetical protein